MPKKSAIADALWAATFAVSMVLVWAAYGTEWSPRAVLLGYAMGGVVAIIYCYLTWPDITATRDRYPRATLLVTESLAVYGLATLAQLIVAAELSLSVAGELRLAGTIIQPVMFFANFCVNLLVPRMTVSVRREVAVKAILTAFASAMIGITCVLIFGFDVFNLATILHLPNNSSIFLVSSILTAGQAMGAGTSIWLVRARLYTKPQIWLSGRLLGALIEPATSVPAGLAFGSLGLAFGPLVNSLVLLSTISIASTSTWISGTTIPSNEEVDSARSNSSLEHEKRLH